MNNDKKLKILKISPYPPPYGGWTMRAYYIKKVCDEQGYSCKILNTGKSRLTKSDQYISLKNGFQYTWVCLTHVLRGYTLQNHINGDSPKGFMLCLISQIIGLIFGRRKVALTFHAGPIQKYFPQSQAPKLTLLYKTLFGIPKVIICNNEAVKKNIVGYNIPSEKVHPIQGFTKQYLDFLPVELDDEIEQFFQEHDQVLFSTAFFRPEYSIDILLKAVKNVTRENPKVGLFMAVSTAYEENYDEIMKLIDELDLGNNLKMAYQLDHNVFLNTLTKSKMYIRTPVKDGVASSVLESLSLGIPVLASKNGTRPESVINYENNVEDLTKKIINTLSNYQESVDNIVKPELDDTLQTELDLLFII